MLVDDLKAQIVAINAKFDSYVAANAIGVALGLKAIAADLLDSTAAKANAQAALDLLAQNAQLGDVATGLDALDKKIADALAANAPPPSTPIVETPAVVVVPAAPILTIVPAAQPPVPEVTPVAPAPPPILTVVPSADPAAPTLVPTA